jgi:hypothetical protein
LRHFFHGEGFFNESQACHDPADNLGSVQTAGEYSEFDRSFTAGSSGQKI